MASIWVDSLARSFEQALDMLAGAVRDCGAELWETSMWRVLAPGADFHFLARDWSPVTDLAQRDALAKLWVERRATPWSVAWHALEVFDYDLNGESGPWSPPPPFAGHPHWRDLASLPAAWAPSEVLGYVDHCRRQMRSALAEMTEERAARPLPASHRYGGQPHARIITGLLVHTAEHAAQIRQFITTG
jgi:hypothetical protein